MICIFEGNDHWVEVRKFAKVIVGGINELVAHPELDFIKLKEDENIPKATLRIVGGGDLSNICSILGVSGCNGPHPCPFCEVSKNDCCQTTPTHLEDLQARDLQRIRLLAHAETGTCPGCNMHIVDKGCVQDPSVEMEVADPDCDPPSRKKWKVYTRTRTLFYLSSHTHSLPS